MNCVGLHYMYRVELPVKKKIKKEIELIVIKQHQRVIPYNKKN